MTDIIEGFLVDTAFVDRTKSVSGMLSQDANQICSFTPHGTTYFNTPVKMVDPGVTADRKVAWTPTTKSMLLVDTAVFTEFSSIYNVLSADQDNALFRIIDLMAFNNDPSATDSDIDAALTADATFAGFYVPKSATRSTSFTATQVWLDNETQVNVSVPNFIRFDVQVTAGTQTTTSTLLIYLNCDTFTQNYSKSTIVTVVPSLPYDTILNASLTNSVGNVFATAAQAADLSYQTLSPDIAVSTLSGTSVFPVPLVDGTNTTNVQFSIYYKGKYPTVSQIRDAIRAAVLNSGVGTEDQWKARAPSLFIAARFYLFPLWDKTVTKPTVVLNQGIVQFRDIVSLNQNVLMSVGMDINLPNQAIFESGYDGMVILSIPDDDFVPIDATLVGSKYLLDYFPDFQSISSMDPNFPLLDPQTQMFIQSLNNVLARASGATSNDQTPITTEGSLTYYSIGVNDLEMCLVTKECYMALVGAAQ